MGDKQGLCMNKKLHCSFTSQFDTLSSCPVARQIVCLCCHLTSGKECFSWLLLAIQLASVLRVDASSSVLASFPRPCAFVACSTKFAQRAWARSSRDVCRSRNFTSHQIWPRRVAALVVEITTNGVGRT